MQVEIARIKIGPRFRQDLGNIEALAASIAEVGLLHPVVLTRDGQLIAGKRRIEAAKFLGWTEIPATMLDLKEIVKGEFAENVARKDFSPSEAVAIAEALEPELREQAKARQGTRTDLNIVENCHEVETGKTRDRVASFVGMSGRTLEKAQAVVEAAKEDPEKFGPVVEEMDRTGKVDPAYKKVKPHVANNSGDNEWYTPKPYIKAASSVMEGIDLDPASHEEANKVVGADKIFTVEDNGLKHDWSGKLWLNPPYASDLVGKFIEKLADSFERGMVSEAVVLVNNATETKWFARLAEVSSFLCFPTGRVKFWHPNKETAAPLQGQCVAYVGLNGERFVEEFSKFGIVAEILK